MCVGGGDSYSDFFGVRCFGPAPYAFWELFKWWQLQVKLWLPVLGGNYEFRKVWHGMESSAV